MRLIPGRQKTRVSEKVSKVLHILPGIYKQNAGQRWVGKGTWAVKVKPITVLESVKGGVLLAQGSPYCLRG